MHLKCHRKHENLTDSIDNECEEAERIRLELDSGCLGKYLKVRNGYEEEDKSLRQQWRDTVG